MRRGSRLGTAGRHGAQTTPCTRCAHSAFGRPYPQIFGYLMYVSHRVATSCRRRAETEQAGPEPEPAPNPVRDFRFRTIQFFISSILSYSRISIRDIGSKHYNPMSWSSRDGSET